MSGNDIKIFSVRNDRGIATAGARDGIELNGIPFEGVTEFKIESGVKKFRLVTMSFFVRNIEWVTLENDDDT